MDVYKDFIQHLRRLAYDEVYLLLGDITPKLTEYVHLLTQVKFQDGSYHTFYGDVKKIISSFMNYFNQAVDDVIKEADKFSNEINKDILMGLVEQTISTHQSNQVEFGNDFLPTTSPSEKLIYEEIDLKYNDFMKKMYAFKETLERMHKKERIEDFAKDHFEIAVKKTSEMFNYTHTYLSVMLVDFLYKIRTSLEEINLRLGKNLDKMQDECEDSLNNLMHQLYDKNKERLAVSRAERRCSVDIAEVNRGIQDIKNKIENFEAEAPISRLEEEVSYWQDRLKDFNEVAENLIKIKAEQVKVDKQQKIYNSMRSTELPGSKRCCWEKMGENFAKQKVYLQQILMEEAKSMITFFACRGTDRILYTDNIGPYYVDEFNHQVYVFDYGMGIYHISCKGELQQVGEEDLYYFDKYGRYVNRDGKKLYQSSPCTSLYQLAGNTLLSKVDDTKNIDADKTRGIRNLEDLQCRRVIKDPNDVAILPDFNAVDITGTLDNETVKYLWDSFGSLLPDALYDVGMEKSKNPIHFLAHKLLHHKYKRTLKEFGQKKTEAEEYRANIFKERKENAVSISKAWKSKQVKRRKPEESDDMLERAVFDAQVAQLDFINSLNYYNV